MMSTSHLDRRERLTAARSETTIGLRVLCLDADVQSTTLALMAGRGIIGPMPDCTIFADTGWEPAAIYDHLARPTAPNLLTFLSTSYRRRASPLALSHSRRCIVRARWIDHAKAAGETARPDPLSLVIAIQWRSARSVVRGRAPRSPSCHTVRS
jgi:hypothetical protein